MVYELQGDDAEDGAAQPSPVGLDATVPPIDVAEIGAAVHQRGRLAEMVFGWGISVGLHVLILLGFVFVTWRLGGRDKPPPERDVAIVAAPAERIYDSAAGPVNMGTSVGELAVPQLEESVPVQPVWDVGNPTRTTSKIERLISIDVDGGGDFAASMKGDWTQLASGAGGTGGGGASFFGLEATGGEFIFVVDHSGSMTGAKLDAAKAELVRAIRGLGRRMKFYIIFFNNTHMPMPDEQLTRATEVNKRRYFKWVSGVRPRGGTDPTGALTQAISLKPDVIWLLSDGDFNPAIARAVQRLNADRKIQIHTIAFYSRGGERVLRQIADQNRGRFRFVSPASIGLEDKPRP